MLVLDDVREQTLKTRLPVNYLCAPDVFGTKTKRNDNKKEPCEQKNKKIVLVGGQKEFLYRELFVVLKDYIITTCFVE